MCNTNSGNGSSMYDKMFLTYFSKKQAPKVPETLLKRRKKNEQARAKQVKANLAAKKVMKSHLIS